MQLCAIVHLLSRTGSSDRSKPECVRELDEQVLPAGSLTGSQCKPLSFSLIHPQSPWSKLQLCIRTPARKWPERWEDHKQWTAKMTLSNKGICTRALYRHVSIPPEHLSVRSKGNDMNPFSAPLCMFSAVKIENTNVAKLWPCYIITCKIWFPPYSFLLNWFNYKGSQFVKVKKYSFPRYNPSTD